MKLRLSEDYAIDTNDYRKEGLRIAILAMSGFFWLQVKSSHFKKGYIIQAIYGA
jgi:ubiquinone biosynthesis protein COQ9